MTAAVNCCYCGETVDKGTSAICNGCGQRFHLNLRNDREGKDCGDVWINEAFLALEFGCFVCLGQAPGGHGQEPPLGRGIRARAIVAD